MQPNAYIWHQLCGQCKDCKKYILHLSDSVQYCTSCLHRNSEQTLGISCAPHRPPSISLPLSLLLLPALPPSSIQYFCIIHIYYITSLGSYPVSVSSEKCTCILSLYLNNEMWDITGCGKYRGFNTQSAKHITIPRSQQEGMRRGGWALLDWRKMVYVSMMYGRLNPLKPLCSLQD